MTQRQIIDAAMTTRARALLRSVLLVLPGGLWLLAFVLIPLLMVLAYAFASKDDYGNVVWSFTADNIRTALGHDALSNAWEPFHLRIMLFSVWIAAATTALCVLLAFPVALWIARRPPAQRLLWLALILVPAFVNLVIRVSAWELLLGRAMPFAQAAAGLGLIDAGASLYPSHGAILLVMVSVMLPFTVLPLYASLERLDWSCVEAARDCYAGGWRTFYHGIFCQVRGGVAAAALLTFVPTMGMYLVSDRLGGSKHDMIGNLIARAFGTVDYPVGAALSLSLIVLSVAAVLLLMLLGRRRGADTSP